MLLAQTAILLYLTTLDYSIKISPAVTALEVDARYKCTAARRGVHEKLIPAHDVIQQRTLLAPLPLVRIVGSWFKRRVRVINNRKSVSTAYSEDCTSRGHGKRATGLGNRPSTRQDALSSGFRTHVWVILACKIAEIVSSKSICASLNVKSVSYTHLTLPTILRV